MEDVNQNLRTVSGIGVLKLSKPVEIDGQTKTEISYDFEQIGGQDIENSMKSLAKAGHTVTLQEFDSALHAEVFSVAAGIDYLDVLRLNGKDYLKAGRLVRDFFFIDLEDIQTQNLSEA